MWTSFTTTPIYNKAALRLPQSGSVGEIEVPLKITKLQTQDEGISVNEITYGTLLDDPSNLGSGGSALSYAASALPTIQVEGWFDTPYTVSAQTTTFGIVIDGYRMTYGDIVAAYFEGRTATSVNNTISSESLPWAQVLPKWFRDSYGRVYTAPRIIELTLQNVAAVPYRETFAMKLQV